MSQTNKAKLKQSLWHIFWLIIAIPLSAFAAQQLWSWFVAPLFSLPLLTLVQAMGLSLVVKYFTHQYDFAVQKEDTENAKIALHIVAPLLALLTGWIIQLFM